jgi:hypothetical protein
VTRVAALSGQEENQPALAKQSEAQRRRWRRVRGGEDGEDAEVKEGETVAVYGAVCSLLATQANELEAKCE